MKTWWRVIKNGHTVDCVNAPTRERALDTAIKTWCKREGSAPISIERLVPAAPKFSYKYTIA